ncbi:MAG: fibronectin/fibrinogen-binding protein [Campylobacteraceae bacterium]|nr:fibronectin/fibrinogen-binding protein [Campylobacteraceae bacterium]
MKYYILKELVTYLKTECKLIKHIKRVENNTILIEFSQKKFIYFDLSKGNSLVYKKRNDAFLNKDFSAPFDTLLQKRFYNATIENITLHNDDKIIRFYVQSKSSYKHLTTILQLEFTGKHTNIIIIDENNCVLEALRHIDGFSSSRVVKVGEPLDEVPKQTFIPKIEEIDDLEELLYETFSLKEEKSLNSLKKQKIMQLEKNCRKLAKLLKSLPQKEDLEIESKELYEKASLILNNLYQIKSYQKTVSVYNYQGEEVELNLESMGNPSVFANKLFSKAKKAKKKSENVSLEKDNLSQKELFLKRMILNINHAKTIDEIEFLYPKKQKNQTKTKKAEPYETFFFNGYKIMLGSDERSNIYLLKNSKASDFWFHLKDQSSSHVIVQNSKKTLHIDVIYKAAEICAKFSVDFGGNYLVDFTQRRNVKVQSGANVLYNPYDTISVKI